MAERRSRRWPDALDMLWQNTLRYAGGQQAGSTGAGVMTAQTAGMTIMETTPVSRKTRKNRASFAAAADTAMTAASRKKSARRGWER